jgi:hypothetical protein
MSSSCAGFPRNLAERLQSVRPGFVHGGADFMQCGKRGTRDF